MNAETLKKTIAVVVLVGLVALPVTAWATASPPFAHSGRSADRGLVGRTAGPVARATGPVNRAMGPMAGGPMMGGMEAVESEFDYLASMIPHHEEAIASAEVLLAGTDRPEMEAFAREIIETQSAEVSQMREWLAAWYPDRDISVDYTPMMRDLTGLTGDELDRAFLEDMIGHHMGAVMMSQQLLVQGLAEHDEVIPFAEQIRDNQHAEIFQMSSWLQGWFDLDAMGGMRATGRMGARH